MKKRKYYMTFYEDIAALHTIYNKQTLFFAGMLSRMDNDQVVQMTPYVRKAIVAEIKSKSTDHLAVARQYLKVLSDNALVADMGDGAYMINPRIHGFSNILSSIDKKMERFIKIRYSSTGKRTSISVDSNAHTLEWKDK